MTNSDEILSYALFHEYKLVIYGAGLYGNNLCLFLEQECGVRVDFFCDQNTELWNKEIRKGIPCISLDELEEQKNDVVVIVAVGIKHEKSVKESFRERNINRYITILDFVKDERVKRIFCKKNINHMKVLQTKRNNPIECMPYRNKISNDAKIAIYTCILNEYDELHQPKFIAPNIDYYVISDKRMDDLGVYQWIDINTIVTDEQENYFLLNRFCKTHGSEIFSQYDYSAYVDGALQIVGNVFPYFEEMGKTGIGMYLNETDDCIYSMGLLMTLQKRCDFELTREQFMHYAEAGMPLHYGYLCGGFIFRDHNNQLGNVLMKRWYEEYQRWPTRDQFALSYIMWEMGLNIEDIGHIFQGKNRLEDKNIRYFDHCQ